MGLLALTFTDKSIYPLSDAKISFFAEVRETLLYGCKDKYLKCCQELHWFIRVSVLGSLTASWPHYPWVVGSVSITRHDFICVD